MRYVRRTMYQWNLHGVERARPHRANLEQFINSKEIRGYEHKGNLLSLST